MKNITKSVGILLTVLSLVACDNTKETFSKSYSNPFTSKEFVDYGQEITKQEAETVFNGIKDYKQALCTREKLLCAETFGITSEVINNGRQYKKA